MNRLFLILVAFGTLQAQIVVDTVAGGKIRSGRPGPRCCARICYGRPWDAGRNLVFTENPHDLIHRVRPDGIIETIAGTGVSWTDP